MADSGGAAVRLMFGIGGWLIAGWVTVCFWVWFVQPVFPLPSMPYGYALGIDLLVANLVPMSPVRPDDDADYRAALAFAKPLTLGVLGWLVHVVIS